MKRSQKPEHIREIKEMVERSSSVVLAHQKGLTVAESNAIRGEMRGKDGRFKVVKNRLMSYALKDEPYSLLLESFKGPVVIFCSPDPLEAAKVSVKAEKELEGKITIIVALADGKLMEVSEVKNLAALPSLEVIRARIIGLLTAAATKLAVLSAEPAGMLARLLRAKSQAADEESSQPAEKEAEAEPVPESREAPEVRAEARESEKAKDKTPEQPPRNPEDIASEKKSDEKSGQEAVAEKAEAPGVDESSAQSEPEPDKKG